MRKPRYRYRKNYDTFLLTSLSKRAISAQAHAHVDEKHFEIVYGSNIVGEYRKLFLAV